MSECRYPLFAVGPEGTTKHSRYLLQFSTGAFVGGRPVTPVLLRYDCRYLPPPSLSHHVLPSLHAGRLRPSVVIALPSLSVTDFLPV